MSETILRSTRLALASLLGVALVARLAIGMSRGAITVIEFLGSFTVLGNLLAVVMLAMLATRPRLAASGRFAYFRGAVTVYMAVGAVLHWSLLTAFATDPNVGEPWVDWSMHVVGPVAVVLDWLIHPPATRLPAKTSATWAIPVALYLGYTLIRGAIIGAYPYPILDPGETGGYGGVALWSVAAVVLTLALALAGGWWADRGSMTALTA